MTLLNAPEFDVQKETRKRNIQIGSLILIAVIAVLAVAGFLLGHGWLFMNLPVEHKVNTFLSALQAQDYPKAYGIFYNDPSWQQHPDKYKDYPLQRFTEDFTTESDWKGPITSFKIGCSKRDATGNRGRFDHQWHIQSDVEVPAFGWDAFVLPVSSFPAGFKRSLLSGGGCFAADGLQLGQDVAERCGLASAVPSAK